MLLEALSVDLASYLLTFLFGHDVLNLLLVDRHWRKLCSQPEHWKHRLGITTPFTTSISDDSQKQVSWPGVYAAQQSFRFVGQRLDQPNACFLHRCSSISIGLSVADALGQRHHEFTIELTFTATQDVTTRRRCVGGILLAAQCVSAIDGPLSRFRVDGAVGGLPFWRSPTRHNFVFITSDGDLFASALSTPQAPVRRRLQWNRWYRLTLRRVGRYEDVFLDGSLVVRRSGECVASWAELTHFQIGTGLVRTTSDDPVRLPPELLRLSEDQVWYGFPRCRGRSPCLATGTFGRRNHGPNRSSIWSDLSTQGARTLQLPSRRGKCPLFASL
ncbi:hypothetical protein PINS_up022423 [Pythium insidiosum]|nr:hypothetical protein PINS_up022423 [Pythium insidiosum]